LGLHLRRATGSASAFWVRPVVVGTTQGEDTSIVSGLSPSEQVVVDGTEKLREGSKVDIRNERDHAAPQSDRPAPAVEKSQRGTQS